MSGMEGMHGDWQHMTGDEVEAALEKGGKAFGADQTAAVSAEREAEDDARAGGGEGAVELEATAPVPTVEVVEPISEAERDALRTPEGPGVGLYTYREPGPNGQYVTGTPGPG